MTDPKPDNPAIAAAFLDRYLNDLESGRSHTLEDYLALYPGHETQIAREFERLREADDHPTRVAHYEVLRELGRGGQGRVYLARDEKLSREVALKILPDHGALSTRAHARFRREAEIAARLDHQGICSVLDTGRCDGVVYIAMRYIDGESLAERVRHTQEDEQARIGLESRDTILATVRLFKRVARAVHAAHEAGIIHRDIKPANIMVTRSGGDPVVLDFGLARSEGDEVGAPGLTRTGEVFGTPFYMSPEQLRGAHIDRRTDVYALGASLYEVLTGRPPIAAESRESLYRSILEVEPQDPKRHNRAIPRDLCAVLSIALEKDRERRYATAADLAEDLRRVASYEPIIARPPTRWTRAMRWIQRNRVVATLAFALFTVLTVTLAVTRNALVESEAANTRLANALGDIVAGKASIRAQEIESRLLEGYHLAYSADPRGAPAALDKVLELDPKNLDAVTARVWLESENPQRALTLLDELVARAGIAELPDVLWLRAFALDNAGRSAEAEQHRQRAGSVRSSMRLYLEGMQTIGGFRAPVSETRKREALALFERAVRRADRPRFHHHHSVLMTAAQLGDVASMQRYAKDLEYHWPEAAATHDAIAQFFMQHDRPRALRSLQQLTQSTRSAAPHCGLAFAAIADGDHERALEHFARAIETDPSFAPAWMMRGNLRMQMEQPRHAREDFLESIRRDARHVAMFDALDRAHAAVNDPSLARKDYALLTHELRDSPHAWAGLGRIEEADGFEIAALHAYERSASLTPPNTRALEGLERLATIAPDKVNAACNRLAESHADSARVWHTIGNVREKTGALDDAIAAYERALEIDPRRHDCRTKLERCRARAQLR